MLIQYIEDMFTSFTKKDVGKEPLFYEWGK